MTEKKKEKGIKPAPMSSFHIEIDRCAGGMRVFVCGVVGIGDYSGETLELKSHGGRLTVRGGKLKICVYENNTVEIHGKVEEMRFSYGKS